MRHFVRQSIERGKVGALNQHYESSISDKLFKTVLHELSMEGTN